MEPLNELLVERIDRYVECLFTPPDPALSQNVADAEAGVTRQIEQTKWPHRCRCQRLQAAVNEDAERTAAAIQNAGDVHPSV